MTTLKAAFFALSVAAGVAGCATTPRSAPSLQGFSDHLTVCPGGGISNAPETDSARRIAGYEPFAKVRGVMLARAPVAGCISSGFGPRRGGAGRFHHGLDLYTRSPSLVVAGGDGVIAGISTLSGYGKTILISHGNGVVTRYAHLSSYAPGLRTGDQVRLGQPIGQTGRTGNATAVHLHYEILLNARPQNPLTVGR